MRAEIEKRPLLVFCGGLILGISAASHPFILLSIPLLLWAIAGLHARIVVAVAFLTGAIIAPAPPALLTERCYVDGMAHVVSIERQHKEGKSFHVQMGESRYAVWAPSSLSVGQGETIHVRAVAAPFREGTESYFLGEELVGRITVSEPWQMRSVAPGPWFFRTADAWRRSFGILCDRTLSAADANWVKAVVFRQPSLDQEEVNSLKETGTVHLISASGIHIFAVVVILQGFFGLFPIPRLVQILLTAFFLTLFAAAVGLQPPIIRAVVMSLLYLLAFSIRREPDVLSSLAFAASAYLLWKPLTIYNMGFQLSFVAVATLALFMRQPLDEFRAKDVVFGHVKGLALASFVLALTMEPLIAYHLGWISTTSVLANVLVVGDVSLLVMLAMAASAVQPLDPAIADGMMVLFAAPLATWAREVITTIASTPFSWIHVPEFSPYWLVPYYGGLLMLWRKRYAVA